MNGIKTQTPVKMATDPHNRSRMPSEEDDEEDPVETMIAKTGCLEKHYAVQVMQRKITHHRSVLSKNADFWRG